MEAVPCATLKSVIVLFALKVVCKTLPALSVPRGSWLIKLVYASHVGALIQHARSVFITRRLRPHNVFSAIMDIY